MVVGAKVSSSSLFTSSSSSSSSSSEEGGGAIERSRISQAEAITPAEKCSSSVVRNQRWERVRDQESLVRFVDEVNDEGRVEREEREREVWERVAHLRASDDERAKSVLCMSERGAKERSRQKEEKERKKKTHIPTTLLLTSFNPINILQTN